MGWGGGRRETYHRNSELNPGFELLELRFNLGFELCVRTLGSGTLCSNPGFGNSMFKPWVRELYVRTPGLGTPCSNPGPQTLEERRVPEPRVRT